MTRGRLAVLALSLVVAGGCSRKPSNEGAPDATTTPVISSASAPPVASAPHMRTSVSPVEARRSRVARFEDGLSLAPTSIAALEKHYGGRAPVDVQAADLDVGLRRALLFADAEKPTSSARPFVLVVDEEGSLAWTKERPVAGIAPPVGPIAIAGGPRGRVALAACDLPTKTVALRLWDDDGSPFADFQVLDTEACDALSLVYWPRHGWIVIAVAVGSTRARLVSEDGALVWANGLDVGVRSRPGAIAPAAIAADTDETFVVVQIAEPSGTTGGAPHVLAFRYDTRGGPIWPAAVDLGEVPRIDRAVLRRIAPGVHVTASSSLDVDVRPSGDFSSKGRAPK